MNRLKKSLQLILGLLVILGLLYIAYLTIHFFYFFFASLQKEVQAALITGVSTVIIAILSIFLGRSFEKKKEIEIAQRDKKITVYEEFTHFWFNYILSLTDAGKHLASYSEQDVITHIAKFSETMLLWGSDSTVKAYVNWRQHSVKMNAASSDTESINSNSESYTSLALFEKLLLEIRKDIGHKSTNFKPGELLGIFLNESDLSSKIKG